MAVTMEWDIRIEQPEDVSGIEDLVRQGFGAGRFAKTAYRLREGVAPVKDLSFVAVDRKSRKLLGSVRFWPIAVGKGSALLLGPLAVSPELRGRGIGVNLMQTGIAEARKKGHRAILLVGDEPYYARVGFAKLNPRQVTFPGPVDPTRILGLSLQDGAVEKLSGHISRAALDIPVAAHAAPLA
jgi:predicted N-acetyltransferase YhbS